MKGRYRYPSIDILSLGCHDLRNSLASFAFLTTGNEMTTEIEQAEAPHQNFDTILTLDFG